MGSKSLANPQEQGGQDSIKEKSIASSSKRELSNSVDDDPVSATDTGASEDFPGDGASEGCAMFVLLERLILILQRQRNERH